jgi:sugar lactone lactonase YvrE
MAVQEDGSLKNKRVFIQFEKGWGVPDGMTTDAEGGLWICCWDGGQVGHFHPDGSLDRFVRLPASRITDCAFSGPNLDTLFVSSAATGKAEEKQAGSLFRLVPGETGMIANRFAG